MINMHAGAWQLRESHTLPCLIPRFQFPSLHSKGPRAYTEDSPAACLSPVHAASLHPATPLQQTASPEYFFNKRCVHTSSKVCLGEEHRGRRPHRPAGEHRLFRKGILEFWVSEARPLRGIMDVVDMSPAGKWAWLKNNKSRTL